MSRDISPRRLGADTFLSRHSAPSFERALAIDEWSSSDDEVSCFVSSHETVRPFFLPVLPFHGRDGAIRFLKQTSRTVIRSDKRHLMVLLETRGLWLSLVIQGGIGWNRRRVFPSTAERLAVQVAPSPMSLRLSRHPACPAHHVGLHLPSVHSAAPLCVPLCVGTVDSVAHCHSRSPLLYPSGPRSGLGYIVPAHLRLIDLIRPTRRHIPISPLGGLYGMPSLCWCA